MQVAVKALPNWYHSSCLVAAMIFSMIGLLGLALVLLAMAVLMVGFAKGTQIWIIGHQLKWIRDKWERKYIQAESYLCHLRFVGFISLLMATALLYAAFRPLYLG
jgi:hypothetical protein